MSLWTQSAAKSEEKNRDKQQYCHFHDSHNQFRSWIQFTVELSCDTLSCDLLPISTIDEVTRELIYNPNGQISINVPSLFVNQVLIAIDNTIIGFPSSIPIIDSLHTSQFKLIQDENKSIHAQLA